MHGTADTTVPAKYSELMVETLARNGGDVKYIPLEGLGHCDGIDYAYKNTDLIDWLLAQRRTDFERVPEICEEMF